MPGSAWIIDEETGRPQYAFSVDAPSAPHGIVIERHGRRRWRHPSEIDRACSTDAEYRVVASIDDDGCWEALYVQVAP